MPFANKVCFTSKAYSKCKCVIPMKEYEGKEYVLYEWAYTYRYYDFVKEANRVLVKQEI